MRLFLQKHISILTIIVALVGLFVELLGFFENYSLFAICTFIKDVFPFNYFLLSPFIIPDTVYYGDSFFVNFLSVFFYLFLSVSAYIHLKYKSSRLLLFLFAIIFILNSIPAISVFFIDVYVYQHLPLFIFTKSLVWVVISFFVIKLFNNNDYDKETSEYYEKVGLGTKKKARVFSRLYNFIIDIELFYIMTWAFIPLREIDHAIFRYTNNSYVYTAIVCYILYCFTFEALFHATPAKFITQTRLVAVESKALSVSRVLLRTVCRLIPFEALSFLAFKTGLHDKLSGTDVVKLKHEPFSNTKAFGVFIATLIISIFIFWTGSNIHFNQKVSSAKTKQEQTNNLINKANDLEVND